MDPKKIKAFALAGGALLLLLLAASHHANNRAGVNNKAFANHANGAALGSSGASCSCAVALVTPPTSLAQGLSTGYAIRAQPRWKTVWVDGVAMQFPEGEPSLLPSEFFNAEVEGEITRFFVQILKQTRVQPRQGSHFVVYDIGMNAGWFTLLTATRGVPVHSVEVQPFCHAIMRGSVGANRLGGLVYQHEFGLSSSPITIDINPYECAGGYTFDVDAARSTDRDKASETVQVGTVSMDQLHESYPNEDIMLMKVDTEGSEVDIFKGGLALLLGENRPAALVVELAPHAWKLKGVEVNDGAELFRRLERDGRYKNYVLSDSTPYTAGVAPSSLPGMQLPVVTVTDWDAFVRQRADRRAGTNIVFLSDRGQRMWFD